MREILIIGDERLRRKAAPVRKVSARVTALIEELYDLLDLAGGIGLAATQIGDLRRVIVLDVPGEKGSGTRRSLVNPVVVSRRGEMVPGEEGCLSVPGVLGEVSRQLVISVRARDEKGRAVTLEAKDLLARCIQHEIDHLDGILFTDRAGIPETEAAQAAREYIAKHGRDWKED